MERSEWVLVSRDVFHLVAVLSCIYRFGQRFLELHLCTSLMLGSVCFFFLQSESWSLQCILTLICSSVSQAAITS